MTRGPDGAITSIYDAAMADRAASVTIVVVGGKEYGTGPSRDWAAKDPAPLGVRAVLAQSFERIHRSNPVGLGLEAGDATWVPAGVPHQFVNRGAGELTIYRVYGGRAVTRTMTATGVTVAQLSAADRGAVAAPAM